MKEYDMMPIIKVLDKAISDLLALQYKQEDYCQLDYRKCPYYAKFERGCMDCEFTHPEEKGSEV